MNLSRESEERISFLYEVARSHGSLISLEELLPLLPQESTESELAEALTSHPSLNSIFKLREGFVTERSEEPGMDPLGAEALNRARAAVGLSHARAFESLMHSNPFKMVCVSGSTSYRSASNSKDIDLFCISPTGKMWLSVAQGLLLARVYGLAHRDSPPVCLSCIMDQDFAESFFASDQGSLFARDALETRVLRGDGVYLSLMGRARWISSVYPGAYAKRTTRLGAVPRPDTNASALSRFINRLLFLTLGNYIKMKSYVLNRRFSAMGEKARIFALKISESHLIYESRRYSDLRLHYSKIPAKRLLGHAQRHGMDLETR